MQEIEQASPHAEDTPQTSESITSSALSSRGDVAPSSFAYRGDPHFQKLLSSFQNAEWAQCLYILNQYLINYPDDPFLLAFKADIEVRIKLQQMRQQAQAEEKAQRVRQIGFRTLVFIAVTLMIGITTFWIVNTYEEQQAQILQEQESARFRQTLELKYQQAEGLIKAGKFADALTLYNDIQTMDANYLDVGSKIEYAKELNSIEILYKQGVAAVLEKDNDRALKILNTLEEKSPRYKDVQQLITKIEKVNKIESLSAQIQQAYARGDWVAVINIHENIEALDPFIDLPDLDTILFTSYRNLIIMIAERPSATIQDIENAEKYYRAALALFPQNREYANEREELQRVAINLLANKYYLYGIGLLESSNYSTRGVREAIRILNKANSIGSGSPAIRAELEKAQLFIDSYDNFLRLKWDESIVGLENLYRKDENYANGMVKYLLYEAYSARGDALTAFAEFDSAAIDYQEAEKFAWSNETNLLRLFQIEVRLAYTLHKLWRVDDSAEFYRYAFERIGYQNRLTTPEEQSTLQQINAAKTALTNGDKWEAVRLYEASLENEQMLYEQIIVRVSRGDTLAQIAFLYGSTINSIRTANNLGESMIFGSDQEIIVPVTSAGNQ